VSDKIRVETGDRRSATVSHPIALILDNLRSAYNVGNIFRLAEVCQIQQIISCGYTACPPHPKLQKTARGCDQLVRSSHAATSIDAVLSLKACGFQLLAVETAEGATNIWDIDFRFPVAFVFGNEALGIAPNALEACDGLARLPVFGVKNSLNVANCAAVVVYAAIRQLLGSERVDTETYTLSR